MDFYLGVAFILFCLWFYRANRGILFLAKDPSSPLPLPPGSMGWPFYGKTREVETDGYTKFTTKQVEKYGRVSKTYYMGEPVLIFAGKELAKMFHLGENKTVEMAFNESIADLFGPESIFCSTGRLHSKLRGLILKSFTPRQIEAYVPVIEKVVRKYIKKWDEAAELGKTQMAQEDFLDLAFEVVATTMLGREPEMMLVKKYDEWVRTMWEAIRSVPPISILQRRVIKTFEVDGYQIPKGWLISLAINHNMKTFNNFTNKSEFDPARFDLDRNEGVKADYAFKPFGAGKRSCVGEPLAWHEMQIFLSLLIRSYKWKVMNYPPPYNTKVLLLVDDGLPVKIEKRAAK